MTMGMAPQLGIEQWDSINPTMDQELRDLRSAVEKKCGEDETLINQTVAFLMPGGGTEGIIAQVRSGIVDKIPFSDAIFPDYVMPDGTRRKIVLPTDIKTFALEALNSYDDAAMQKVGEIEDLWNTTYKPHSAAPKKLHEASESWQKIAETVQPMPGEVAQVQQIRGWQGEGAEAYGKTVPHQREATSSTQQLAGESGNVLANASVGLQSLYLSFAAQLGQAKQLIEQYQVDGVAKGWNWLYNTGPRARYAIQVLDDTISFLRDTLPGSETSWADNVDDASTIITDNEHLDENIFVDGSWPVSEADKLPNIEPGGDTGMPDPYGGMPPEAYSVPEPTPSTPSVVPPATGTDTSGNTDFNADDSFADNPSSIDMPGG